MVLRIVVINEYDEEIEECDIVDDKLNEDEINNFLNNKYGKLKWLGYNKEK